MRALDLPHPAFIPPREERERPRLYIPIEAPAYPPKRPEPEEDDPGPINIPLIEEDEPNSCGLTFRF